MIRNNNWNKGKATRLYSRQQYGYLKVHKINIVPQMILNTLAAGITVSALPKKSTGRLGLEARKRQIWEKWMKKWEKKEGARVRAIMKGYKVPSHLR